MWSECCKRVFYSLTLVLAVFAGEAFASTSMELLTRNEQGRVLDSIGIGGERVVLSESQFLAEIEDTILGTNPGADSVSLRRPVSEANLRSLQGRLLLRGRFMPLHELRAATDYAQALMRESNVRPLSKLVEKLPSQQRNAFHGKVAEVAEARARGMVLTRSDRSTIWDLTESKSRPLNLQMKVYAQSSKALSSLLDDLERSLDFQKGGVLTQDTLDREFKAGRVRRVGGDYQPVGRTDVKLYPSKVFSRPAESHLYANTGRAGLVRLERSATEPSPTGLRWLRPAGIAVLVATEGYLVWGVSSGTMSDREFITGQSAVGGGLAGGWAGAYGGALIGGLLPPPLDVVGVPAGAVIGGIAGAMAGSKLGVTAANGFYGRLDEEQKEKVAADIYKTYAVAQN